MTEHRPAYSAHSGTTDKRQFPPDTPETRHDTILSSESDAGIIIVVSDSHRYPTPLLYHLGNHSLAITHDYGSPDPFELAAPIIDDEPAVFMTDDELTAPMTGAMTSPHQVDVMILDHDEAYRLYRCLHDLLFMPQSGESAVAVDPGESVVVVPSRAESPMKHYQINITLFRGAAQTAKVSAENANEAVITALLQMGVVSLIEVRGIIIDTLTSRAGGSHEDR